MDSYRVQKKKMGRVILDVERFLKAIGPGHNNNFVFYDRKS